MMRATNTAEMKMGFSRLTTETFCWFTSRSYSRELTGWLDCPMILRFTE